MSDYEQKNGTGVLWKNDKYEKGGKYPYANGIIKGLTGEDLDVALWIPKSEKIKGFNVTMKPYEAREKKDEGYATTPPEAEDLPF